MCGVAGSVYFDEAGDDRKWLSEVAQDLKRRGPDGTSLMVDQGVGFVATRLAMVDPSGSTQPLYSADRRWLMLGNGEIYNFRALRRAPELESYAFRTEGDMEVALAMFVTCGVEGLERLRGPFAIAIWDRQLQTLWLAKDAVGERPLFYHNAQPFRFSSHMTSFGLSSDGPCTVNSRVLATWIGLGWSSSAATLINSVAPVEAGTALEVRRGSIKVHRYRVSSARPRIFDMNEAVEEFSVVFNQAVDRCLVSDRPLAVAFSGGLDSTAILKRVLAHSEAKAITLISGRHKDKNRTRAAMVAELLGCEHIEVTSATPNADDAFGQLGRLLDTPAPLPIALHNLALSRATASNWPGLLAGHGADALFAGYTRYHRVHARGLLQRSQVDAPSTLNSLPFSPYFREWPRMREIYQWLRKSRVFVNSESFDEQSARDATRELASATAGQTDTHLEIMQAIDFNLLNVHDNCILPDQSGMAYGLEQRAPFLDRDLIDLAFSLDSGCRVEQGKGKLVLRRYLLENSLGCLLNLNKIGFDDGFAYDEWMEQQRALIVSHILEGPLWNSGLLVPTLANRLRRNASFFTEHSAVVWRLFAASAWLDANVKKVSLKISG